MLKPTLTDYEIDSLASRFCLADGHAYHDPHPAFNEIIQNLGELWERTRRATIPADLPREFKANLI